MSSYQENIDNLERLYAILRKHKPKARIVFTLSPIPLVATFRPVSCLTASTVSKAILRTALDELIRNHQEDDRLYYWPSYEIVKECFTDPYVEDNRHVKSEVLETVMRKFEQYYMAETQPTKRPAKRSIFVNRLAAMQRHLIRFAKHLNSASRPTDLGGAAAVGPRNDGPSSS